MSAFVAVRDDQAVADAPQLNPAPPPRPSPRVRGGERLEYTGLTGLRAVAVALVVGYHFLPDSLPGGFLGVDVFFAVSGYLITRLLLRSGAAGGLSLRDFYVRRIRRLFPALGALLLVVTAAALVWRDQLATIRGGVLAAGTYTSNWWLVFGHQSYFVASGRPSMLQHLWSLAIEEQFYVIWPVTLLLLNRRFGGTGERLRRAVIAVAGTFAVLSALLMYWRAVATDVPYGADGSRLYFGTDTHVTGLLLGAALGAWVQLRPVRSGDARQRPIPRGGHPLPRVLRAPWLTDAIGLWALVVLVEWGRTWTEFAPALFRTGFASIAVVCCILIAAITRRGSALGRLLDAKPLYWIGERSYGIYLWHWPVAVVTRPGIDIDASPAQVAVLRIALTLLLAEASHRFVEQPVRRDGWDGVQRGVRIWRSTVLLPATGVALGLAAALALLLPGQAAPGIVGAPADQHPIVTPTAVPTTPVPLRDTAPPPHRSAPAPHSSTTPGSTAGAPKPGPTSKPTPKPTPVASLFGDSVLLGAAPALRSTFGRVTFDAVEGRLPRPIFKDIQAAAAAGKLGRIVVIHVGNNGVISPDDLATTLHGLSGAQRVIVVNDRVDRPWESVNNHLLASVVPHFANARLVDWFSLASAHEDWFYGDGLHLTPSGAVQYARLIAAAVHS